MPIKPGFDKLLLGGRVDPGDQDSVAVDDQFDAAAAGVAGQPVPDVRDELADRVGGPDSG